MGLYRLLISLLCNGKGTPETFVSKDNPVKPPMTFATTGIDENTQRILLDSNRKNTKKYLGYCGVVTTLKDCVKRFLDFKTFETYCRTMSKEKVHELAALPRLMEKCADALVKASREDMALSLFDLSQMKHMVSEGTP